MFRTKKSILLLPLASLGVYVLAVVFVGIIWEMGFNRISDWTIVMSCKCLIPFCCTGSITCGTLAVKLKADRFPRLVWYATALLYLSAIYTICLWFLTAVFPQVITHYITPTSYVDHAESLLLLGWFFCFLSCMSSFFVFIRESDRDGIDFHTLVIFATQILWIFFAIASAKLAHLIALSLAC